MIKSKKLVIIAGWAGLLLLAAVISLWWSVDRVGSGRGSGPVLTPVQNLATFTENFVDVTIVLEKDATGNTILAATYSPTQSYYHLYSKDLPQKGIDGAGRPTLLEIRGDQLHPTGPLEADQPVIYHEVKGFSAAFPIYPDGPVTLRLPVKPISPKETSVEISVTYMACSSHGRCLPPVVDRKIMITLPAKMPVLP